MIRLRQPIFCLLAATVFCTVLTASAQTPVATPVKIFPTPPNLIPLPPPPPQSPVNFFRSLLAMSPKERADYLTNRPPEIRARILAKIHEYLVLAPDERELRLTATDLRWYLMPLLSLNPTNRAERLALMPDDLRPLVKDRLTQWDILPPPLKQEFLDNDRALHYFARVEPPPLPNGFPEASPQKISQQFDQFLELTPEEKQKTLNTLSAAERAQMQKTLAKFDQLPAAQRMLCVRNYAKFAGLSVAERSEFLQNAAHWEKMSPAERQTWRDLVAHVPQWPPMPPMIPPNLIPHAMPPMSRPNVATN